MAIASEESSRPSSEDIQLDPPSAKHPDVRPAREDQTYVGFIAAALIIAIVAGFLLAVVLPVVLAGDMPGATRLPGLIQAHGWAQLQGWAGLFVAGMAVRLIPRFAGRKPVPGRITLPILTLLVVSVVLRIIVQPWGSGDAGAVLLAAAGIAGGLGMAGIAVVLLVTLARGRKRGEAWEMFAWAGSAWWAAWAVYTAVALWRAAGDGLLVAGRLDLAMIWLVFFGVAGNFIWGVQSRSVRVFFGRKLPRRNVLLAPAVALNLGLLLVLVAAAADPGGFASRTEGVGLALAGGATAALAPLAGSVWGSAHRLRPRARWAARYVLAANAWAIVGGLLLVYAGLVTLLDGQFAGFAARDAARHAFGVGLITMLIIGMAQLIAPMFALGRAGAERPSLVLRLPFWLLLVATTLRVLAGLFQGELDSAPVYHTMGLAGVLAWVALVLFAIGVLNAVRAEPRMKELLARGGT